MAFRSDETILKLQIDSSHSMQNRISKAVLTSLIAGYMVLVGLVAWGMTAWRQAVVTNLSTPQAQAAWNEWRAEAAQEDGTRGPVQRAAPKSPEPPMLVLLRDYFTACVVGLLVPLSALYAFIAWIIWGMLRQNSGRIR